MNFDEATSETLQKILTTFVSFFCEEKKEVVARHPVSLNMPSVTTDDIYNALVSLFDEKKIPWEHCLASLMVHAMSCGEAKTVSRKSCVKQYVQTYSMSMVIVAITYITAVRYLHKCSVNISNIFSNPFIVTSNAQKVIETF